MISHWQLVYLLSILLVQLPRDDQLKPTPALHITGHSSGLTHASFSRDSSRVAFADRQGRIRVCSTDSGEESLTIVNEHWETGWQTGKGPPNLKNLEFSPDGHSLLATSAAHRQFNIWNSYSGEEELSYRYAGPPGVARYSPDGRSLVCAGDGLIVVSTATGRSRLRRLGPDEFNWPVMAVNPNGYSVAIARGGYVAIRGLRWGRLWGEIKIEGRLVLWKMPPDRVKPMMVLDDVLPSQPTATVIISGYVGPVTCSAFSSDGSRIAASDSEGNIRVCATKSGKQLLHARPVETAISAST